MSTWQDMWPCLAWSIRTEFKQLLWGSIKVNHNSWSTRGSYCLTCMECSPHSELLASGFGLWQILDPNPRATIPSQLRKLSMNKDYRRDWGHRSCPHPTVGGLASFGRVHLSPMRRLIPIHGITMSGAWHFQATATENSPHLKNHSETPLLLHAHTGWTELGTPHF